MNVLTHLDTTLPRTSAKDTIAGTPAGPRHVFSKVCKRLGRVYQKWPAKTFRLSSANEEKLIEFFNEHEDLPVHMNTLGEVFVINVAEDDISGYLFGLCDRETLAVTCFFVTATEEWDHVFMNLHLHVDEYPEKLVTKSLEPLLMDAAARCARRLWTGGVPGSSFGRTWTEWCRFLPRQNRYSADWHVCASMCRCGDPFWQPFMFDDPMTSWHRFYKSPTPGQVSSGTWTSPPLRPQLTQRGWILPRPPRTKSVHLPGLGATFQSTPSAGAGMGKWTQATSHQTRGFPCQAPVCRRL
ncbi:hypothetical protein EJ06DRAFT_218230 [Trichodelitschia bisporula]|uniref:Uncharacterized protein n=1 Tax=Trichodelitschia bisporula TaxID=703511 RepID=A0A6G1I8X1_9PEZI|nr:hypothetical protein EJ06DRAFT_218230 [Trichodelitschia bisporula]